MTLKEAQEALDQRQIVSRKAWYESGAQKYLMLNGDRTQTVDSLYSGQMKEILTFAGADEIEFVRHYDLIVVPEYGKAHMIVGYDFSWEDAIGDDYYIVELLVVTEKDLTELALTNVVVGDRIILGPTLTDKEVESLTKP